MIDSMVSLAFSVYANKGGYALLLGSGVSRSAAIPTGWEIVLDLIKKLAAVQGVPCDPDPETWYTNKFGEAPDYSRLLEGVAKTQAERSQILKGYFEPSSHERELGLKVPTRAHRAIANLVANGYVRVVVTTNFDRLTEMAVEAAGIAPVVVAGPSAAEGMPPLHQVPCVIIKVHGDYLDTRIKNIPAELAKYDARMDRLLDTIFDDFGLIVCGWSAEWDIALCDALDRCKNRRFTTFWAARGHLGDRAKHHVTFKSAEFIQISDADSFFPELQGKVMALAEVDAPHPLSRKIATALLKKYLGDEHQRIALHDLVMSETEKLYDSTSDTQFPIQGVNFSFEELLSRINRYEALTEIVRDIFINGCYWGQDQHRSLWTRCLERVANRSSLKSGMFTGDWLNLRLYPSLLLLYASGISSVASERWGNLRATLVEPLFEKLNGRKRSLILAVYPYSVIRPEIADQLPGMERRYTPVSDWLFIKLRESFRPLLPRDADYERCFDRFECLRSLIHADLQEKETGTTVQPLGRFAWKSFSASDSNPITQLEADVTTAGSRWPLLACGFFDDSVERFQNLMNSLKQRVGSLGWM
ncbi:MAG TPA: SIR2 family protein [Terriglobia bacterium]|nr:SIR2 family protein [Terriglobia bacterium]